MQRQRPPGTAETLLIRLACRLEKAILTIDTIGDALCLERCNGLPSRAEPSDELV